MSYDTVLKAVRELLGAGEIEQAIEKAKENQAVQFMLGEYLAGRETENGSSSAAEGTPSEHGVDKGTRKETPGKDGAE